MGCLSSQYATPTPRFAVNHFPSLIRVVVLALGLVLVAWAQPVRAQSPGDVELSLDQARNLAVYALQSGDPGLAIQLSRGLLQANPKDPVAHYVIASAFAQLNQPRASRIAAARAYRFSDPGPDRFRAAQLAAQMAYAERRYSLAQIWLRRTAIHVETEDEKKLVARDYQLLRRQNPWSFRVQTDLRPSSNVNNGSDTALQIIDGVPVTGTLSGAARALSGLIGSVDLSTGYRLRANATSATTIGARLFVQRVALSGAAKDLAPDASGADYASTFAEMSLRHGFAVGPPERRGSGAVDLALGESWWGGERSYRFGRITAERAWALQPRTRLEIYALAERRFKSRYRVNDARVFGMGAEIGRAMANGDRLNVTVALRDTDAKSANGSFTSASLRTSYTFKRPVGPARLTAGLVLGYSDYPVFRSGLLLVPGGRQDRSVYGDVSLFFDRYDYAGFAPLLRLRTGRKKSNDSRFTTRDLSVSLGIASKF